MEREHTLRILNALAGGIHPATGEKFAADSPYQHPDIVRALFEAARRRGRPPAAGGGRRIETRAAPERGRLALDHRGGTAPRHGI